MQYLPLTVCLIGLVLYLAAKDGKVSEIGRLAFIIGLVFTLYFGVHHP